MPLQNRLSKIVAAGFAVAALSLASPFAPTHAQADEIKVGEHITITAPFARASAGMARAGGGFLTITNEGPTDNLIAASADVSERVELHTHIRDGEVMRMRHVDQIDVTGGSVTELAPGGLHVMFIGLKDPLVEGTSFPVTLTFEDAGEVTFDMPVAGPGARHAPGHEPATN